MTNRRFGSTIFALIPFVPILSAADLGPPSSAEIACEIGGFALEIEESELLNRLNEKGIGEDSIERKFQDGVDSIVANGVNFIMFQGRVERIFTENPNYSLSNGIKVGSSISDVFAALGETEISAPNRFGFLSYNCADSQAPNISRALILITEGDEVVVLSVILNRQ